MQRVMSAAAAGRTPVDPQRASHSRECEHRLVRACAVATASDICRELRRAGAIGSERSGPGPRCDVGRWKGSGRSEVAGRCRTGTRVLYAGALAGCGSFKASCSFAVSSSDSDVLMTVPPYSPRAAIALSGVACSMIMNSAEVPGLTFRAGDKRSLGCRPWSQIQGGAVIRKLCMLGDETNTHEPF